MCSYPDGVSITLPAHMSHSALIVLILDHNILPALYCVCFLLETQDNGRTMYTAIEYGQSTSTIHYYELPTRDLFVCDLFDDRNTGQGVQRALVSDNGYFFMTNKMYKYLKWILWPVVPVWQIYFLIQVEVSRGYWLIIWWQQIIRVKRSEQSVWSAFFWPISAQCASA